MASHAYTLSQRFHFDAAHTLNREIEAEGSKRVHGHTYYVEVSINGSPDPASGMVIDLGFVRKAITDVRAQLDHHFLDEVSGLGIPTLENICTFIYRQLAPRIAGVCAVRVWRDSVGDGCTYAPT